MFDNSTLGIYKNLAALRQNPAFLNADIEFPSEDNNVLAYIRTDGSRQYLVVMHFGQNPTTVTINNHSLGFVEAATKGTYKRLHKKIDVRNIFLNRGDGLVVQLL